MKMASSKFCPHCGKNLNYTAGFMHLPAGFVIHSNHPYVVGAALSQGKQSITYIGLDMATNQRVAIKEFFPTLCCSRTGTNSVKVDIGQESNYQNELHSFLAEARLQKNLSDLNYVTKVLDFFEFNNTAYIVMEYLEGNSLQDYIREHGKYPAQIFLKLVRPLMEDLDRMHQRGMLHLNITPENIILLPDGQLKLTGFGGGRSFIEDNTTSTVVHRPYAPAEQLQQQNVAPSTDVYALAATIYFCITGHVPKDALMRQYDGLPLPSPGSMGVNLTPSQEQALNNALAVQHMERTQSISEFMAQLDAQVASTPPATRNTKKSKPPKKKKKIIPILVVLLMVAALSVGGFLLYRSYVDPESSDSEMQYDAEDLPADSSEKPEHTLMADVPSASGSIGQYPAFGGKYTRDQIASVTFLTSTKKASSDSWDVSEDQDGSVMAWVEPNGKLYDLYIGADGGVLAPEDCSSLFASYENLSRIDFGNAFDTSNVTNMSSMFYGCKVLTELNVSGFDTAKVTNMCHMFQKCTMLIYPDLSGFDVSNVEHYDQFMDSWRTLYGHPWEEFFTK